MQGELQALRAHAANRGEVVVDCRGLRRMEFVAAGDLLNEVVTMRSAGKQVLFVEPNYLVYALMLVMGIRISPRSAGVRSDPRLPSRPRAAQAFPRRAGLPAPVDPISHSMEQFHGTTIVSVRRGTTVALGGDGQVTLGNVVIKAGARKVRRLYNDQVLAGFAGGTADAFTLFERFEAKLDKHSGHLVRAAVELAKDWRTDRMLRRLEAMLAVADRGVARHHRQRRRVEPEHRLIAIGSGGPYAQSAARAREHRARRRDDRPQVLAIAGEICIYTNQHHTIETLG